MQYHCSRISIILQQLKMRLAFTTLTHYQAEYQQVMLSVGGENSHMLMKASYTPSLEDTSCALFVFVGKMKVRYVSKRLHTLAKTFEASLYAVAYSPMWNSKHCWFFLLERERYLQQSPWIQYFGSKSGESLLTRSHFRGLDDLNVIGQRS